jgi:hypothetical protein
VAAEQVTDCRGRKGRRRDVEGKEEMERRCCGAKKEVEVEENGGR